jgi:hypothetical protein
MSTRLPLGYDRTDKILVGIGVVLFAIFIAFAVVEWNGPNGLVWCAFASAGACIACLTARNVRCWHMQRRHGTMR